MCEIAVFDPEQSSIETVNQVAGTFYREQGDGLGFVIVVDEGDRYDYRTYKSTQPHWQTVFSFLRRNWDDAWRVVVHARASTTGDVNRTNAHPIEVDCPCTDFQYVVHNGHVRSHADHFEGLEKSDDHELNTRVDSEIIAHDVKEIPDESELNELSIRNDLNIKGNLHFLLFSEQGIFVRVGQKYHLSNDLTMTCRPHKLDDFERGNETEWLVARPGGEISTAERTVWYSGSSTGSSRSTYRSAWGNYYNRGSNSRSQTSANSSRTGTRSSTDDEQDEETYTVTYKDLLPNIERVACFKVAPGVIRLVNRAEDVSDYVYRWNDPETYYYYAPEEPPEDVDELEAEAQLPAQEEDSQDEYSAAQSREALVHVLQNQEDVSRETAEMMADDLEAHVSG